LKNDQRKIAIWQSNIPLDLQKGLDLPNNQSKSLSNARQKIRRKRRRKEKFSSEKPVLDDDEQAKSHKKQQSNVPFPLEKRPVNFWIRAVFIAMKKTKKEEYVSDMCFASSNACSLITWYHRFIIVSCCNLQPNRFPKGPWYLVLLP